MSKFKSPNYTQIPNDFFDMIPEMSDAELRVTLVIMRETFGYHRNAARVGMNELAKRSGLSYNGAAAGCAAAGERGTFERVNPDEKIKAEWILSVETPSASEGVLHKHPQPVREEPSASEGQVGLNKEEINKKKTGVISKHPKRGDIVDGIIAFSQSASMKKANAIDEIKSAVRVQLAMRPTGKDFDEFCAAVLEEKKQGHELSDFIAWWILNGGRREYWSFGRMATMYPMAFRQPASATTSAPIFQAPATPVPPMSREDAEKVAKARQAARAALGVR